MTKVGEHVKICWNGTTPDLTMLGRNNHRVVALIPDGIMIEGELGAFPIHSWVKIPPKNTERMPYPPQR